MGFGNKEKNPELIEKSKKIVERENREWHEEGDLIEFYDKKSGRYNTINVDCIRRPTGAQLNHLIKMIEEDVPAIPSIDDVYESFSIVLSLSYREKNKKGEWVGGPMYYIKNGLKVKWLAGIFAVFVMVACLGTGNATQSNSIAVALESTVGIKPWITGLVLTVIAAAVILGGMRRIAAENEKLVPIMAVFYVLSSVIALIVNADKIPSAFALIFKEAFNFRATVGGAAGYGIMVAMHYGFSRGVFSNEAGLGSAPIAHAASSTKDPVQQGLWGMFEVFFTTIIICTISALIILTTGIWETGTVLGSALSIASFNSILPGVGGIIITLATVFFALSTILGWAYYGEVSIEYLSKNSKIAVVVYRCIYVLFVFIGAVGSLDLIWSISETMNGLMAIPNLIGIIGLSKVVTSATKKHFNNLKVK